jgi:uncharacterized protein YndB with AHSA1/START domain
MSATMTTQDHEIVMTRVFDAPRELVYRAWTEPEHLIKWFGPNGFTSTFESFDARVGGEWRFTMHGPDGTDYPNYAVFDLLEPHSRIAFRHGSGPDDPGMFEVTVTLADLDGKTELTQRSVFRSVEQLEAVKSFGAVELGYQTLDKLGAHLHTM